MDQLYEQPIVLPTVTVPVKRKCSLCDEPGQIVDKDGWTITLCDDHTKIDRKKN